MDQTRFKFLICEDVRREIAGAKSFMGVANSIVKLKSSTIDQLTAACIVRGDDGCDLSKHEIHINVDVDGSSSRIFPFHQIPAQKRSDSDSRDREYLARLVPEYRFERGVLGLVKLLNIEVEKYAVVTAFVDGVEYDRVLFFVDPALLKSRQAEQKTPVKRKASGVKKRV